MTFAFWKTSCKICLPHRVSAIANRSLAIAGTWPGLRNSYKSMVLSTTCLMVATELDASQRSGIREIIVSSKSGLHRRNEKGST